MTMIAQSPFLLPKLTSRYENGRKDRKTASTISVTIFFSETKSKTVKSETKTILEISENQKYGRNVGTDRKPVTNTKTLNYKNIYLTLHKYVICIHKFKLILYKL
jgi:hypothetical protein